MEYLSDELLFEAYNKAIELELDTDFIRLIRDEINNRASTNFEYKQ